MTECLVCSKPHKAEVCNISQTTSQFNEFQLEELIAALGKLWNVWPRSGRASVSCNLNDSFLYLSGVEDRPHYLPHAMVHISDRIQSGPFDVVTSVFITFSRNSPGS